MDAGGCHLPSATLPAPCPLWPPPTPIPAELRVEDVVQEVTDLLQASDPHRITLAGVRRGEGGLVHVPGPNLGRGGGGRHTLAVGGEACATQ